MIVKPQRLGTVLRFPAIARAALRTGRVMRLRVQISFKRITIEHFLRVRFR